MRYTIKLIPADPEYVPDQWSQEVTMELLRSYFRLGIDPQSLITATVSEHVEFVGDLDKMHQITCWYCSVQLPVEWWHEAMDRANEKHFADLRITTPCCHTPSSLAELEYGRPAGFARFVIEIYADHQAWFDDWTGRQLLERICRALGCEVKLIIPYP